MNLQFNVQIQIQGEQEDRDRYQQLGKSKGAAAFSKALLELCDIATQDFPNLVTAYQERKKIKGKGSFEDDRLSNFFGPWLSRMILLSHAIGDGQNVDFDSLNDALTKDAVMSNNFSATIANLSYSFADPSAAKPPAPPKP